MLGSLSYFGALESHIIHHSDLNISCLLWTLDRPCQCRARIEKASIVLIRSTSGKFNPAYQSEYAASKSGKWDGWFWYLLLFPQPWLFVRYMYVLNSLPKNDIIAPKVVLTALCNLPDCNGCSFLCVSPSHKESPQPLLYEWIVFIGKDSSQKSCHIPGHCQWDHGIQYYFWSCQWFLWLVEGWKGTVEYARWYSKCIFMSKRSWKF